MVRLVPRAFAATVALLAAGFSPATASADPVLVFPGMEIRQDNHVCTLGYVDPALKIAFTAGHCRGGGAVTSRDYKVIGHLRAFRDNTPSGSTVATHELIADYEAIVLADGWFTMSHGVLSEKGDSGGPVYLAPDGGPAQIVGIFNSVWGGFPAAVSWRSTSEQVHADLGVTPLA